MPVIVRMTPRDTEEEHRTATPLELFFDLTFVVAVAAAQRERPPRLCHRRRRARPRHLSARLLRDLVGVDELHVVRLRLRHRRCAVSHRRVRRDDRRADPGGRHPSGLRRHELRRHDRRLRGHAFGDGGAVGARGTAASRGSNVRIPICDRHQRRADRLGAQALALPRRLDRGVLPVGSGRDRGADVGRGGGAHALASPPHRRAVRPLHDHRARRVGALRDRRCADGDRPRHAVQRPRRSSSSAGCSRCSRCGGSTSISPTKSSRNGFGHAFAERISGAFAWGYGHYVVFVSRRRPALVSSSRSIT